MSEDMVFKMVQYIIEQKESLTPEVLSEWYNIIKEDYIKIAPDELKDKLEIEQDPILPMKFNVKVSKRAIEYFIAAVEKNLSRMPKPTQIYFMKVEELVLKRYEEEVKGKS
ncbi:MAG: hypothetical protein ACP5LX_01665 [Nitrososphaeria archaeon]